MRDVFCGNLCSSHKNGSEAAHAGPYEELWWTFGPAVLIALQDTGSRIPPRISLRLRNWIDQLLSEDPVPALDLSCLQQGYRDLSVIHLASYAYTVDPDWTPQRPPGERVVMIDRGHAYALGRAQYCVAQIARALHGIAGARSLLVAVEHERTLRRQLAALVVGATSET